MLVLRSLSGTEIPPTARADDLTDIVNAVVGDFSAGQSAYGEALMDFGAGHFPGGVDFIRKGVDDDLVGALNNLLIETLSLGAADALGL